MVSFRELSLRYRVAGAFLDAVDSASADCPHLAISAIVGRSGCGKTSLLRAAAGLLAPSSGSVWVNGRQVQGPEPHSALVFQDHGLLPWRTVEANASLPLELSGVQPKERRARIGPILQELGLYEHRSMFPSQLSGGQKQRLGLARALASKPELLLMDEPFSGLDALTRESAQNFLLALWASHPMTIVLVTHSIEEAAYLASHVHVMTGTHPGRFGAHIHLPWNDAGCRAALSTTPGEANTDARSTDRFLEACGRIRHALGSDPL